MLSQGLSPAPDRLGRAGIWLLAVAASLGAGMLAVGVVAWVALESILADTHNVDVDWHSGRRIALAADIAATLVLTALTLVVLFAARRVTVDRGRFMAGILALALVFACALPSAGWFWLIAQDALPSDAAFVQDAYGHWYFPVVGAFGSAYALAAAGAAVLLLLPHRHQASTGDGDWLAPATVADPWAPSPAAGPNSWAPPPPIADTWPPSPTAADTRPHSPTIPDARNYPPTIPDLWAPSTSGSESWPPPAGPPSATAPPSVGGRGDGPADGERLP